MAEDTNKNDIPQEETPAQETQQPSAHDYVHGRLRESYPDADLDSEDGRYGAVQNYMKDTSDRIARYQDSENRLTDILNKNEMSAALFAAMARGEDPISFMVELYGPDIVEQINTDEGRKAIAEANAKWAKNQQQKAKDKEEWDANIGKSLDSLHKFAQEHGLDAEQEAAVFDKIWSFGTKAIMGTYDESDWDLGLKALNYDTDVSTARQEGEVTGRNARIMERRERSGKAEGMPTSMGGSVSEGEKPKAPKKPTREEMDRIDPFNVRRFIRK